LWVNRPPALIASILNTRLLCSETLESPLRFQERKLVWSPAFHRKAQLRDIIVPEADRTQTIRTRWLVKDEIPTAGTRIEVLRIH